MRPPGWIRRLAEEHDNVRAALSWSLREDEAEFGLRLASALQPFWTQRGHYGEGRGWLEAALATAREAAAKAEAEREAAIAEREAVALAAREAAARVEAGRQA